MIFLHCFQEPLLTMNLAVNGMKSSTYLYQQWKQQRTLLPFNSIPNGAVRCKLIHYLKNSPVLSVFFSNCYPVACFQSWRTGLTKKFTDNFALCLLPVDHIFNFFFQGFLIRVLPGWFIFSDTTIFQHHCVFTLTKVQIQWAKWEKVTLG